MATRPVRTDEGALFVAGDPVAILGLGASGLSAARLAHARGADVYASDASSGTRQVAAAEALREEGIDAEAGRHDLARILGASVVVTSPGIDPATEVRTAVRDANLRTIAEVELAYRYLRSKLIGVTGTNGKTTVTALLGHLLDVAEVPALTAGNIGRPLSEVSLMDDQPEWVAAELSSFQLADLETFRATIGVLLNLAPDHLDRYANLDRYFEDKARLFANASAESRWVLNADDDRVGQLSRDVPGERYAVSLEPHGEDGAFIDDEGWMTQRIGGETLRWMPASELRLAGAHNRMNAMLAGMAAALAGCPPEAIAEGLTSFRGLPHRLEPIAEFDGVLWVNDSKGTNISATRAALEAFDRPLVVLLGGRHKGEPYASLLPAIGEARAVVAFGESAPLIVRELSEHVELEVANGFEEAIRRARALARPGDVVLFSPACSSYDMFPSYAVRGKAFEEHVKTLEKETT